MRPWAVAVSVPVPSAVDRETDLRQKMMKEELPIAPEISEFLTVGMAFEPFGLGLGYRHGLGCFAGNADMIKVDGMIQLVLRRSNHHGVSRDIFIHGNVNAQKKTDDQKTDHKDGNNFTRLRSSHGGVLEQSPRLNAKNFTMFKRESQISVILLLLCPWKGKFEKLDLFIPHHFLLFPSRRPLDVLLFTDSVMHSKGFLCKVGAHILEMLVHIVDNLFCKLPVVDGIRSFFRFRPGCLGGDRREHSSHYRVPANRACHKLLESLFLKGSAVVEPALKAMPACALQVKYNQEFITPKKGGFSGVTASYEAVTSQRKERPRSLWFPDRGT
ncbi:MAG: hypothetical protein H6Q48_2771 [Deltaproteobacteria bacterium]|nr:hypothetical protein [Deltaproteobacteria bacterium]